MDPTRKDAGKAANKLYVTVELDLGTELTTIESNIRDPAVMLRIIGQGMHIWSSDHMKKVATALQPANGKRPPLLMIPKH